MTRLVFCVPAFGRFRMAEACLRGLARTCEDLGDFGIAATAFVVADDRNLETAEALGFGSVRRENMPLGRKFNDAIEAAYKVGADYVVPFGTDDLVDPVALVASLPEAGEIKAFTRSAVVNETGTRLARLHLKYPGGDGVRVFPIGLFEPLAYRPADEDKPRAIDTSIYTRLKARTGAEPRFVYADIHELQVVDFKTSGEQLNPYEACLSHIVGDELEDPFGALAEHYDEDVLDQIMAAYDLPVAA